MRIGETALLVAAMALQGCGVIYPALRSESKLFNIELGQSRKEVISSIGSPNVVRESKRLEDGKTLQVDEYRLYSKYEWLKNAALGPFVLTISWWVPLLRNSNSYLVQYVDGKMERWARAQDWQGGLSVNMTTRQK